MTKKIVEVIEDPSRDKSGLGEVKRLQSDPKFLDGVFAIIRNNVEGILDNRFDMTALKLSEFGVMAARSANEILKFSEATSAIGDKSAAAQEKDFRMFCAYSEAAAARTIAALAIHMVEHELRMRASEPKEAS